MKLKLTLLSSCIFLLIGFLSSCKKETNQPEEEQTPVNTTPPIFNWKINNTTSFSSDSTYCYNSFYDLYAYRGGTVNSIYIQLSSFNVGTYTISSANGTALQLVASGVTYTSAAAQLTISSNSSGKLSGKVNATFTSTKVASMSGEFTDIPRRN